MKYSESREVIIDHLTHLEEFLNKSLRLCQKRLKRFSYFRIRPILITMIVSFFIGCIVSSMSLIPQFAEDLLNMPPGSGGFYCVALAIFALIGPPVGGKLVDKYGPKIVMLCSLPVMVLGFGILAFVALTEPNVVLMIVGLCIAGLGMGFAMGAPTNYMIIDNTKKSEATSAVATLVLVRQIGTTIGPSIFVAMGYSFMMIAVAVCSLLSTLVMSFYKK